MQDDKIINRWLISIDAKPNTTKSYIKAIKDYGEFLDKSVDEILKDYYEDIKKGRLMPERQIFYDIPAYLEYLKHEKPNRFKRNGDDPNGLSQKSIHIHKSALKSFFASNYIEFPILKRGKKTQPLPVNANRFLTRDQVKEIISNAPNLRDRAICLLIATSGMGSNEIRNLKISDTSIDENDIITFKLRREKAEYDYVTFCTPEATAAIREYWNERERILEKSEADHKDIRQDEYVFVGTWKKHIINNTQIIERSITSIFKRIGQGLGYEIKESGELIATRSHALRKFFSNTMRRNGMPKDYCDVLLGHVPDDVDRAYFQNLTETLKIEYIKYLPHLSFKEDIIVKSLNSEDAKRLAELETKTTQQEDENNELRAKMDKMDKTISGILDEKTIEKLIEKRAREILDEKLQHYEK